MTAAAKPLKFTQEPGKQGKDYYLAKRSSKNGGDFYSKNITGSREPEYSRYVNIQLGDDGLPSEVSYQADIGSSEYVRVPLTPSKSGKAYWAKTETQFFLVLPPKTFTFKDKATGEEITKTSCRLSIVPPDYDFTSGELKPLEKNAEGVASDEAAAVAPAKRGYSKS